MTRSALSNPFGLDEVEVVQIYPRPMFARALYDYDGSSEGRLVIRKGDVIRIILQAHNGWWDGAIQAPEYGNATTRGWFPSNFVELCAAPEAPYSEMRA
jgi:hypothetical protein